MAQSNVEHVTSDRSGNLSEIAHLKRFLEWFHADPDFRQQVRTDPLGAARRRRLTVDPEAIRPLWDSEDQARDGEPLPDAVRRYREHIQSQIDWREGVIKASAPHDRRFRVWRDRQRARCRVVMYLGNERTTVHSPVCFELSQGCSVGCWFCGVGAQRLTNTFAYTADNARLWREVLEVVGRIVGPAAAHGFCYWATDPLDNPDYEKLASDFADILGIFPQTTTALGWKNPARTRALFELSRRKGCAVNRFSVLTLSLLSRIHQEFTPEELVDVEIIAQNNESSLVKANAGGFRQRARTRPEIVEHERVKLRSMLDRVIGQEQRAGLHEHAEALDRVLQPATSIACVSGFLFNMVERSVKIISPCPASDRWPLGYMVFGEGRFDTASDVEPLLQRLIAEHMRTSVTPESTPRLHAGLTYHELDEGFMVSSPCRDVDYRSPDQAAFLRDLGRCLERGDVTVSELTLRGLYHHGVPEATTRKILNAILAMGVLEEQPDAQARLTASAGVNQGTPVEDAGWTVSGREISG